MAKAKKSQSEKIREYLKAHPKAAAGEIAKSLKVSPGLVYNVKAKMNGKATKKKTKKASTRKTSARRNGQVRPAAFSSDTLVQAAELLKNCGGVDEATQVLKAVAHVADTLND